MVVALAKWTVQNAAPAACYLLGSGALQLSAKSLRYHADRHILAHGMRDTERLAVSGLHLSLLGASFCCTLKSVQAFKRHKQRKWIIRRVFEFPPTLLILSLPVTMNIDEAKKSVASVREDWLCFSVFKRMIRLNMIRLKQQPAPPSFFSSDRLAALFEKDDSGYLGLDLAFFKPLYHSYFAIKTEKDDEAFSFFYGKYKELLFLYLDAVRRGKTTESFRAGLNPEQRRLLDFYYLFTQFINPNSTWQAHQIFGDLHNFTGVKAAFNAYPNPSNNAQPATDVAHKVSDQWKELIDAVQSTKELYVGAFFQSCSLTSENVDLLELSKVQALSEKLRAVAKRHFDLEVTIPPISFQSCILSLSTSEKKQLKKEIKTLRLVLLKALRKKLHTDKYEHYKIINCVSIEPEEVKNEQELYASETSKHAIHLTTILEDMKNKLKDFQ